MNRAIYTYGLQGTKKPGGKPEHHAIVYTTDKAPTELPRESKLPNALIRLTPKSHTDVLEPSSRLNYAKVYTVEHNLKVCFIGRVHENSKSAFKGAYDAL
jgi:hypothetical protein